MNFLREKSSKKMLSSASSNTGATVNETHQATDIEEQIRLVGVKIKEAKDEVKKWAGLLNPLLEKRINGEDYDKELFDILVKKKEAAQTRLDKLQDEKLKLQDEKLELIRQKGQQQSEKTDFSKVKFVERKRSDSLANERLPWVGREEYMDEAIEDMIVCSKHFSYKTKPQKFYVIKGASGIGKTRFGMQLIDSFETRHGSSYECFSFSDAITNYGELVEYCRRYSLSYHEMLKLFLLNIASGDLWQTLIHVTLVDVFNKIISECYTNEANKQKILFLHIDEFQAETEFVSKILRGIYRCLIGGAGVKRAPFYIIPVLTGISANGIENSKIFNEITGYGAKTIYLQPFKSKVLKESLIMALNELLIDKLNSEDDYGMLDILFSEFGDVPLCYEYVLYYFENKKQLLRGMVKKSNCLEIGDVIKVRDAVKKGINTRYGKESWVKKLGSLKIGEDGKRPVIQKLMLFALGGIKVETSIRVDTSIEGCKTFKECAETGLITLTPQNKVFIPPLLIDILNEHTDRQVIENESVLNPFKQTDFMSLEHIAAWSMYMRILAFAEYGKTSITLGDLREGCIMNDKVKKHVINISKRTKLIELSRHVQAGDALVHGLMNQLSLELPSQSESIIMLAYKNQEAVDVFAYFPSGVDGSVATLIGSQQQSREIVGNSGKTSSSEKLYRVDSLCKKVIDFCKVNIKVDDSCMIIGEVFTDKSSKQNIQSIDDSIFIFGDNIPNICGGMISQNRKRLHNTIKSDSESRKKLKQ